MHIVLSGNTGSGKTTLATELGARLKIPVISSGVIARNLAKGDAATDLALKLGAMAPEQAMRAEIRAEIEGADIRRGGWILDGFPRSVEQLICLLQWSAAMPSFIHIELNEWTCIERLGYREREHDNPDAIAKRMESYRAQTLRMVDVLNSGGVVDVVDGNLQTIHQADYVMSGIERMV